MTRIAVLGAGKIGESLLSGLISAGWSPGELQFTERYPARAAELTDRYGVAAVEVAQAVRDADVLAVAVKPQDIDPLLAEVAPNMTGRELVVSLCAGLPTSLFERSLPAGTAVVRVMPNTPMLVGEAMSAISGGAHAQDADLKLVEEMMSSVGSAVLVPEGQQDAATALSGSGPAYFYYLVESMIEAGVLAGVPRDTAAELVVQSAAGAAAMLRTDGAHPGRLREAVTSPGGTTAAGLRELDRHGVRSAVVDAVEAARQRSAELGRAHED
ncbi:pyrroline-5-carboxylate reductase [Saccharopolyspora sp. HNM0983]|uniref:Pyrroline-5-carboxylate reductase n=1 Tax=Saccharopolyspora montiporae TaxID=2781240 RepID=A0A929BC07_9PSEU|nr:pyrroline-5-carboxylate reductase [Saccharopolyspora sp. HNM0983]MBE9374868.1 pyrroline-5-carboxylate reductase [Saccharopolyspora sp. HNM0983]